MEQTKEKRAYQPPVITRIILRKEQAILSQCSASRSSSSTTGSICVSGGCRKARSGTKDNTVDS